MEIRLEISAQGSNVEVRIFKDPQSPTSYKEYTLLVRKHGEENIFTLPPHELYELFEAVRAARICPYSDGGPLMLDGKSYELQLGHTSYRWSQGEVAGWEGLSDIVARVLNFAMRYTGNFYVL